MATTQEFYRLGSRLPRYTTKLSTFANGMYLTNQIIPEGYAKIMANYDIDDTGSCIRPRRGREQIQVLDYDSEALGPASLTDYVYSYKEDESEVEDIKDIVLSYGMFTKLTDLAAADNYLYTRPIFVSYMDRIKDTTMYALDENGSYVVQQEGEITTSSIKDFWALAYNKEQEQFDKINNEDIGYIAARTISNAYAFDKPFKDVVGRPIGVVFNNEIITFTGGKLTYKEFTNNTERNELINFDMPKLSKLKIINKSDGLSIKHSQLSARVLNPIEASATGFNMLSDTPYTFEDEQGGSLSVLGVLLYDSVDNTKVLFNSKLGTPVTMRVYYQYPNKDVTIKYKIETLDLTTNNSTWEVLTNFTESIKSGEPLYYTITPKSESIVVRITVRENDNTATEFPYPRTIHSGSNSYSGLEGAEFDLSTCKGMISWLGCVGVYGVDNAPGTIFFSDVEDPGYFPFPQNLIEFDNEILAVHNYLDHLIVVTVDSVWLVTAGNTIATSTQKRILANIHIPEIDAMNLVVLKDQIFFKTDTQFYVLKPNQYTSDSTDLKNYINSTAIANYTTNFTEETVKLLNKLYPNIWQSFTRERRKQIRFEDFDVLDTRSIVRDAEVHYIYTIVPKLTDGIVLDNINLHFVYNTLTRSWRLYFVAIGDDDVYYAPILYRNKQSGAYYEFFPYSVDTNNSSIIISKQTYNVVTDDLVRGNWHLTKHYNNYPYIDTGSISVDDTNTKRFREVQFNLMNMEPVTISFYSDFALDGHERVHATQYEMQHITDEQDPDYGKIYVTPIECTNMSLVGMTSLADNITESDHWSLDLSKFPALSVATVRFQLQGRGRRGSLQLLNTSLQRYELADMHWVYRVMSAR